MRAGIVAIVFFTGLLALGHYVAAPVFCSGGLAIPSLDPRALCGADLHLNRSGSVLLYFSSIAAAVFFGIVATLLPSRGPRAAEKPVEAKPEVKSEAEPEVKSEETKPEPTASETFEQIAAAQEQQEQKADALAPETNAAEAVAATSDQPVEQPIDQSIDQPIDQPIEQPLEQPSEQPIEEPSIALEAQPDVMSAADAMPAAETPPVAIVTPQPVAPSEPAGPTMAAAEAAQATIMGAISEPQPAAPAARDNIEPPAPVVRKTSSGAFDGSNEELLELFRELKKTDGVSAIAQAQRLLDESTMSALSRGVDPKAHLSQIAHLVLTDDPDLKSAVVRGVVVHIAARLKELGIAKPAFTGAAKGAA